MVLDEGDGAEQFARWDAVLRATAPCTPVPVLVPEAQAVVEGWRSDGIAVCPEDAAEDLDDVTVTPGLGLVPWLVDVHCAQRGTLPRLVEAVLRTGGTGVALDEGTALHLGPSGATVDGAGSAHRVVAAGAGAVTLTTVRRGGGLPAELRAG